MEEVHFTNLLIVAGPIAIGPSGLGWVEIDLPVDVLSVIIFPLLGLSLLRRGGDRMAPEVGSRPSAAMPVLSVEDRALCSGAPNPAS